MKRPVTRRSRPPTYNTATRLARIVHGLLSRPHGWSFDAIQAELSISERTLLRYLAACRRELVDADGHPVLEVIRRGERRLLRLADAARAPESTAYQALSFYFALTVFRFLDATILKDGVDDLWQRFYRALPQAQQARLADFDRKFYSVPYAMKDYASDRLRAAFCRSLTRHCRCVRAREPNAVTNWPTAATASRANCHARPGFHPS